MSKTLTVVLPVHNAEASLRRDVANVLDIASDLDTELRVFIVDDGSTDDTYDAAMELAARYPQLQVMRHAQRQGLGKAIETLRTHVEGDCVLVHDGASPIDAGQIRHLYLEDQLLTRARNNRDVSIDDLHRAVVLHSSMAEAHSRLLGFQRLASTGDTETPLKRRDAQQAKSGVGAIPPLPRPNFMGALANFAMGE